MSPTDPSLLVLASFFAVQIIHRWLLALTAGLALMPLIPQLSILSNRTNLSEIKPALMPFWDDLDGENGGIACYVTTGTAPNRVFTFQYKNWYSNTSLPTAGTPNISFQVKLYETTNVIEYIYKQLTPPNNSSSATIGIADGATPPTYLSLNNSNASPTASSTTFTNNISIVPATNQLYRFSPTATTPSCSTVTTWPSPTAATLAPAAICASDTVITLISPPLSPRSPA